MPPYGMGKALAQIVRVLFGHRRAKEAVMAFADQGLRRAFH